MKVEFFYYLVFCTSSWIVSSEKLEFTALNVALLEPNGVKILQKLEKHLWSAINNLGEIIRVNASMSDEIPMKKVLDCSPQLLDQSFRIRLAREETIKIDFEDGKIGLENGKFNFLLILGQDFEKCKVDDTLLATASPCYIEGSNRPLLGLLNICPGQRRWKKFSMITDLFRHEILHSLGFGMIKEKNENKLNDESGLFLDFDKRATDFMIKSFDCDGLAGILSDDERKTHLDQKIFKTELMTAVLSNRRNFFTNISAMILEDTHLNDGLFEPIK
ncbi:unnamed protein product, partial [Mesorhabditis belari]|uniref:Leishmanolysin-like peptidase n=1 Tax=Mesorhabditis belari TaxID=2138241 RepID=A0AAF3J5S5_9BILA